MADLTFSQWRPHPWHGLSAGADAPRVVNAYIEITPFDLIKYEVDKASGYLRVDRPQRTSSQPPALYGFIPRTYCGPRVAALTPVTKRGDGDPLDICVLSERPIAKSEILLSARVIGGLQLVDRDEADDKIIAVLQGDYVWGDAQDLERRADRARRAPRALLLHVQTRPRRAGAHPHLRLVRLRARRERGAGGDGRLRRAVRRTRVKDFILEISFDARDAALEELVQSRLYLTPSTGSSSSEANGTTTISAYFDDRR